MASPAVSYTFANSTTADATQVNQNFTDIINGITDGTKDLSISALTCAGNATLNGDTAIGNASGDTLTITASLGSSVPIKTTNTYDIGSATKGLKRIYFGTSAGSNSINLVAPSITSDYTVTLPSATCTLAAQESSVAKTTNYTATSSDFIITCDATAAAFTITLPAAASNQYKQYLIKKIDVTFSAVTIDGNAAETIDGAATTTINTQFESIKIFCDGSNWIILERFIPNNLPAWTPTLSASFGTTSNLSTIGHREGRYFIGEIFVTLGTVTAAVGSISLPTGLLLDSAYLTVPGNTTSASGPLIGDFAANGGNNYGTLVTAYGTSTSLIYIGNLTGAANMLIPGNVNAAIASSVDVAFNLKVPIAGWKG